MQTTTLVQRVLTLANLLHGMRATARIPTDVSESIALTQIHTFIEQYDLYFAVLLC